MAQPAFEEIAETFEFLDDWEDRYRHVIELGKAMDPLEDALKVPATKVEGCASQVWLLPEIEGTGPGATFRFRGESDAMIVRGLVAILIAFVGVMIMTLGQNQLSLRTLFSGLAGKTTLIGLACGLALGLSAVFFRGAALSLEDSGMLMRSAFTLAIATTIQTLILLVWLRVFQPGQIRRTIGQWRSCTLVGFAGWAASIFWFMAFTLTHAAYVRALGQIELIFTFLAFVFFFRERVSRTEVIGVILLSGAIVLLVLENAV